VIAAPKEEMSGKYFVVEWLPTKERTRFQRGSTGGKILRLQDAGMAGYYNPFALPVPVYIPISVAKSAPCQPTFFIGDQVQINPTITSEELKEKQKNFGGYIDPMDKVSSVYLFLKFQLKCNIFLPQYIGVAGTVQYIADTNVYVKFHGRSWLWIFNPTILQKLNKFSVNQSVRIRSDANTVKQMKKEEESIAKYEKVNLVPIPKFAILKKQINNIYKLFQVIGAIGRVTHIDEKDPDRLYVQFNDESLYKWVSRRILLPSVWMEDYAPEQPRPTLKEQVTGLVSKGIDLFFHAVDEGDLDTIKELRKHYRVDFDAWKRDGKTALQLACEKNHKDLVEWFINEAKVGLDVNGIQGFRAIHYAAHRW